MGSETLEPKGDASQEIYKVKSLPARQFCSISKDHHNLIRATFLNSLRIGNDWFKLIDQDSYYKKYATFIDSLLHRPTCKIRYAELDENTIIGWCLHEGETIHYIWVKKDGHRKGIATSLIPKDFSRMTHITHRVLNIWTRKFPEVKFDPFL